MKFSKPIFQLIKERTSWRSYSDKPLEKDLREDLKDILKIKQVVSPFSIAGKCRFELISLSEFDPKEKKRLGTYGIIKGAQDFIVGAVEKSKYDRENYGYLMESIILKITDLGLGTCWLGGFFNRSIFSAKINISSEETIPAISPVGYRPNKRSTRGKLIRSYIKANKRYPWDQLFFENNFSKPLVEEDLDEYGILLEMVRLGPSASNRQPWRIFKEPDKNIFHFYILYSKKENDYNKFRRIDIGIAVSHFNLTAVELKLSGKWEFTNPDLPDSKGLLYIISWNGS